MKLKDKIAVITGGASGIGEFGTRRFAAEGATVIMLDINETAGNNLASKLDNVFFIKTDNSHRTLGKTGRGCRTCMLPCIRRQRIS